MDGCRTVDYVGRAEHTGWQRGAISKSVICSIKITVRSFLIQIVSKCRCPSLLLLCKGWQLNQIESAH